MFVSQLFLKSKDKQIKIVHKKNKLMLKIKIALNMIKKLIKSSMDNFKNKIGSKNANTVSTD